MSSELLMGLAIAIPLLVVAQVIHVRALARLNTDQRNQVVTYRAAGSSRRTVLIVGLVMLTITIFAIMEAIDVPTPSFLMVPAAVLAFTPALWGQVTYVRGLRALGLPEQYVVAVQRSRLLNAVGVLAFIGTLVFPRA